MKRALLIGIPLLLVIGIVLAVATLGIIKIPGISPKNYGRPMVASPNPQPGFEWTFAHSVQTLADQSDVAKRKVATIGTPDAETPGSKPDPTLGDAKLAAFWNGLEPDQLVKITAKWNKVPLCKVLLKMDPDQVTAYLGVIDPKRADELSREIQLLGSIPPPPPAS